MVELRVAVNGSNSEVDSLWDWLRQEPELRGRVRRRSVPPPPGVMGPVVELVIDSLVSGTVGAIANQLGQSLSTWLTRPRARDAGQVRVTVTLANGQNVSLTTANALDAERLLRLALDVAEPPDRTPG